MHHSIPDIAIPHLIRSTTCVFKNLSVEILILRAFLAQMANHVASWEDEEGWTHSNCPDGYNFPKMLCDLSRYLAHSQCPEYAVKMVTENEAQVYQAYIYLPPHPEGAQMIREIAPTLREAFEAVALEALAELCERHSVQLKDAPAAFLPIHYQADQPWRFRRLQMLEHQEHIAAHLARYERDITGAQLATTAEYALNVFNLQIHQKLEIQRLKHQVGQLRAANTTLVEQVEAAQDQNADLQITVAELNNQLQHMLINDGINMQLEVNAVEEEEEEPTEIQGESGVASGFLDEPTHVEGAQVIPAHELSDEESSVNQPILAIPAAHDLIVFPEEMYAQVMDAARRHGVDFDNVFAIYPPPRQ